MSEWRECKLGEMVKTNVTSITAGYPFNEILYLDTGSITKGKIEGLQNLSISKSPSRAKRLVKENDIIYSTVRPIQRHYGFITNPPENLVVSTGFTVITCNENQINPKFLYYYFTSDSIVEELDMLAEASTSTYPSLKPSDIEKLQAYFPIEIEEQKAIAAVLSSLDDKIDLLHRQNKTLEAMAETLFKQWFVVEAREEWEEYAISDFAEHIKINIVPSKNMDTLFHHYSLPAYDLGQKPTVELGSEILSNKFKVVENSILVSKLNPRFPRIWAISSLHNQVAICSTEFQVLKPKNEKVFGYLYFLLHSNDVTEELTMASSGTSGSHQRVKPEDIFNVKTLLPSVSLAEKFSIQVLPNIKKIEANRVQIQTLETLRDNLLPKLMSGEVRVKLTPEETPCKPIMK